MHKVYKCDYLNGGNMKKVIFGSALFIGGTMLMLIASFQTGVSIITLQERPFFLWSGIVISCIGLFLGVWGVFLKDNSEK